MSKATKTGVVAFLQNQWFKKPRLMERLLETQFKGDREKFTETFLFFRNRSGSRIRSVFGEALIEQITWANASPCISGDPKGCFPADARHMMDVIKRHDPHTILCFGRIAENGIIAMHDAIQSRRRTMIISGPHPMAYGDTIQRLNAMKVLLEIELNEIRKLTGTEL